MDPTREFIIDPDTRHVLPSRELIDRFWRKQLLERYEDARAEGDLPDLNALVETLTWARYQELKEAGGEVAHFEELEWLVDGNDPFYEAEYASCEVDRLLRRMRAGKPVSASHVQVELPERGSLHKARGILLVRYPTGDGSDPDFINLVLLEGQEHGVERAAAILGLPVVAGAAEHIFQHRTGLIDRWR